MRLHSRRSRMTIPSTPSVPGLADRVRALNLFERSGGGTLAIEKRLIADFKEVHALPNEAFLLSVLDAEIPLRGLFLTRKYNLHLLAIVQRFPANYVFAPVVAAVCGDMSGVDIKPRSCSRP